MTRGHMLYCWLFVVPLIVEELPIVKNPEGIEDKEQRSKVQNL